MTQEIVSYPHSPAEEPTTSSYSSSNVYDSAGAAAGTTTYIRWGRTVCPDSSKLVYFGYAAGTFFNTYGGGVGPICLPAPSSKKLECLEYQPGFQRLGSCVDEDMTFFKGTKPSNDGMEFYTIKIENHPSLCPPFLECDGRELSCVVYALSS